MMRSLSFLQRFQGRYTRVAVAVGAGLLGFGAAIGVLSFFTPQPIADNPLFAAHVVEPADTLAAHISEGGVAIAVPANSQEILFASARPGDRLDVISLVAMVPDAPDVPVVVAHGATYLGKAPGSGSPILLQVTPQAGLVISHLVQTNSRLIYDLWPKSGPPLTTIPITPAIRPGPTPAG